MDKKKDILLILKAVRRSNREEEIRKYGKCINYTSIVKNRKKYTRKIKHKLLNRDEMR